MRANLLLATMALGWVSSALAHPGSGLAVDARGAVYFTDTGKGIAKLEPGGRLTYVSHEGLHWLALDEAGRFARAGDLPGGFHRVTTPGQRPALLTGSDFPFTFGADGDLYYPGPRGLIRVRPHGGEARHAAVPAALAPGAATGIAVGPDGSLYLMVVGGDAAHEIVRVTRAGEVSTFASAFVPRPRHPVSDVAPTFCRGLAVDGRGIVFVAATGSRRVLSISQKGDVSVVLNAEPPWAPTAAAVRGSDLYILEYDLTPVPGREWPPRVRQVDRRGNVTTLVTLPRERGATEAAR